METKERLTSLDAFRGFTIAGMMLVNNPGSWSNIYPQLKHAEWHGWTFTDWIFPFFLFIVGVAMVFSFSKVTTEEKNKVYIKIIKRALLIYAFGFFLSGFPYFNLSKIRVVGVLQRISFCYFFTSIIYLNTKSYKSRVGWILFLLFFYWAVMEFFPVPGIGAGLYEKGKNFSNWFDSITLTGHMWSQTKTWDPEGIFSTLPAIATTLFGVLTGEFIRSKKSENEKTIYLFFTGQIFLLIGLIWDNYLPINKSLWTSSYSVFMTGWALVVLSFLYFLIDVKGYKKYAKPLVIFGLNPLIVFILAGVFARLMGLIKIQTEPEKFISLHQYLYHNYFTQVGSPINASLLWAICFMLLMYLISWGMWKKKIILKV